MAIVFCSGFWYNLLPTVMGITAFFLGFNMDDKFLWNLELVDPIVVTQFLLLSILFIFSSSGMKLKFSFFGF